MAALHCILWDFIIFAGMKPRLSIILAFFFVAACYHPVKVVEPAETPSPELVAIDSLMWQRPDSALSVLMDYMNDGCKDAARHVSTDQTFDNHYAHLLLAELLYKNDYAQTNRTELRQTVAYFDSLVREAPPLKRGLGGFRTLRNRKDDLVFLTARAHYINGVGYYERDSMVEACSEYLKALETMEGHFKEKELVGKRAKFMALTYTHLTGPFSDQYLHEQVINFGRLSLTYYQKYNALPWHVAWMFEEMGAHYDMMEQLDSACFYYQKAIAIINDTTTLIYRDIATRKAFLLYKMEKLPEYPLRQLLKLLSQAESEKEYLSSCAIIGEIYYHEKQFDSAEFYFNKVFQNTDNENLKRQGAKLLVDVFKTQGRETEIGEYAEFLAPFATIDEDNSIIKTQLTELYKTFIQERLERQHHKETRKQIIRTLTVIVGMFFVILLISLLYHKSRKHKRNLETLIESERQAHKIQQAALSGRLKRSNAALKEHNKAIHTSNLSSGSLRQNSSIANYEEEPICQHILALCSDKKNPIKSTVPVVAYADIALDDTQKAQLKDAAMQHHGSMFEKLEQQHPELKEKDFQYCYLCLLGLDNVQIAVLLQNSISTIWEREKRLKKILGSRERIAIILRGYMIN